ncbi:hypothetical protein Aperf_G00000065521 [Anoplocephala perfoliata]
MKIENGQNVSSFEYLVQKSRQRHSSTRANKSRMRGSSRSSIKRRSGSGEGNHTLDAFSFTSKGSKVKNADVAPGSINSGNDCPPKFIKMKRSPHMPKPGSSAVRLRIKESVRDKLKNSNSDNLMGTSSETGSVLKRRKEGLHLDGDKHPNNPSQRQLKRRRSAIYVGNAEVAEPTNEVSPESTNLIKSRRSKSSRLAKVRSQKRTKNFRKLSGAHMTDKDDETAVFEPSSIKIEVDEPKTIPTSLFGDKLWTDEYSPSALSDMVLNCSDVSSLVSWIKSWIPRSTMSRHRTLSSAKRPSLEEFSCSEDSRGSSVSNSLSFWRRSAYLILGPTGCGKTCLVYTLASEFGFKVFELNPSACRSGKEVISQCSQVMISRHVSTEGLSASSSAPDLFKPIVSKLRESQISTLASFFQPKKRPPSKPLPLTANKTSIMRKGLKLSNKSLILFDEVDALFDSDRGFWAAVGKLLQMGRRPIILTASDPTVVHEIPVPIQICRLKPLLSPILVEPVLQRICDSQSIHMADSIIPSLTSPNIEDRNCDIPNRISSTARRIVLNREFSDIRRSIVRLQWLLGSKYQGSDLPTENTRKNGNDLFADCVVAFPPLFSLSWSSLCSQKAPQDVAKPQTDDFGGIFDSENEKQSDRPLVDMKIETQSTTQVGIPLAQSRKLSFDLLSTLSQSSEIQGLLDVCSTQIGRKEISRGINALPISLVTSSSTLNLLTIFGEVYSAPFSGIDPEGTVGSFAVEEELKRLLHSVTSKQLQSIQQELTSTPPISQTESGEQVGSYVNGTLYEENLFRFPAFDQAVRTMAILEAFNAETKSGESLFQHESALDYLPALRDISKVEVDRRGSSTRRRFFHYFDQIGLRLSEDIRGFLSQ